MRSLPLFALLSLLVVGCSSKDDPAPASTDAGEDPLCTEIIEACHPVDPGSGPINDCHVAAHEARESGDHATCASKHDACVAICEAAAADAGGDAMDHDAMDHDAMDHDAMDHDAMAMDATGD